MQFQLDKPLIFFDLEATGLNVLRDRILQIGMMKFKPGEDIPEEYNRLINPGIPISEEAMSVHGITPGDVARKPLFSQVAEEILAFIGDADLAGYHSNRFDLPMLIEEFARAGITFEMENRRTIDVQRIFYKMEPRTLAAALQFYCDKDLEDAHDAMADVRATVEVLKGQIRKYAGKPDPSGNAGVRNDIQALHDFTNDFRTIDATQRLRRAHDGQIVFNFGKYEGKPVAKTLYEDKQYYHWMLNKEFSQQVKQMIRKLVSEYRKTQNAKT